MNAYGGALVVLTGDRLVQVDPTHAAARAIAPSLALTVIWYVIGETISSSAREHGVHRAHADALPARAVDRHEPGRLLLRPPRPLRDHRDVPARRHLRRWAWRGLAAYSVGFAAEVPFMILPDPRQLELHRCARQAVRPTSTSPGWSASWSPRPCTWSVRPLASTWSRARHGCGASERRAARTIDREVAQVEAEPAMTEPVADASSTDGRIGRSTPAVVPRFAGPPHLRPAAARRRGAADLDVAVVGVPVRRGCELPARRPLRPRPHPRVLAPAAAVQPRPADLAVRAPAGRRLRRPRREPVLDRRGGRARSSAARGPAAANVPRACSPWAVTTPSRCRCCASLSRRARPGRGRALRRPPRHLGHLLRRALHARHPVPARARGRPARPSGLPARRHPRPAVRAS